MGSLSGVKTKTQKNLKRGMSFHFTYMAFMGLAYFQITKLKNWLILLTMVTTHYSWKEYKICNIKFERQLGYGARVQETEPC